MIQHSSSNSIYFKTWLSFNLLVRFSSKLISILLHFKPGQIISITSSWYIWTVKCLHEQFPHMYNYPWEKRNACSSAAYVFLAHPWLYTLHAPRTKFQFWNWSSGMETPSVGYRLNPCISSEFVFLFALQNLHFSGFSVHFSILKKQHTQYSFRLKYTIKGTLDVCYIQNIHHTHMNSHISLFPSWIHSDVEMKENDFSVRCRKNWNGQIYANSFHAMVW